MAAARFRFSFRSLLPLPLLLLLLSVLGASARNEEDARALDPTGRVLGF